VLHHALPLDLLTKGRRKLPFPSKPKRKDQISNNKSAYYNT